MAIRWGLTAVSDAAKVAQARPRKGCAIRNVKTTTKARIVGLFNAFRPPLVIVLTIPFALIGISFGLLATGTPFGFLALLGAMSLAGMMIKNAIVLLDEININLAAGRPPYESVIEAALSRLQPVVLAAATTVLGVIPLLQDVFWVGMAITLMAGLSFGTLLTMFLVPTLYAILFRIPSPTKA